MRSFAALALALASLTCLAVGEGIDCRGSAYCPIATFENSLGTTIMQGLRNAIRQSSLSDDTVYKSGDHVSCVGTSIQISIGPSFVGLSGSIPTGGICVFPQNLKQTITLSKVKTLIDLLLEHNCKTCGSIPIDFDQGSNDPSNGILTFNFVSKAVCIGNCIGSTGYTGTKSGSGSASSSSSSSPAIQSSSPATTVTQTSLQPSTVYVTEQPSSSSSSQTVATVFVTAAGTSSSQQTTATVTGGSSQTPSHTAAGSARSRRDVKAFIPAWTVAALVAAVHSGLLASLGRIVRHKLL